jgi:CubicO group peptidase (beta-lactamase class C family)
MRFRKLLDIRLVLALVLALGASFLLLDATSGGGRRGGPGHLDRIDAYVEAEMSASHIPGVALAVVEDGRTVHARGFGNDGRGNAITADTPFWIGSNTKSITALAVRQLSEAGKVDLDAPVQRYLPDFRVEDPEAAARISVRHLLNQTSGFSRADGVKMVAEGKEQSLQEAVASFRQIELNRPVGESYQYSNLNFVVLGAVVEVVSGETWTAYVQQHILEPLGMSRTYTSLEEAKAHGLTQTHAYAFGFPYEAEGKYLAGSASTGYVYSTAADMARYLTMYLQGGELDGRRVLSRQGIAEMLSPATNLATFQLQSQEFAARYGEGWFVGEFGAATDARWHQGSLPYFTAWMVQLPETKQGLTLLINAGNQFELGGANSAFSRLPQGAVNVLRGQDPPEGVSVTRFFIVFDTALAMVLALQTWSLIRVARGDGGSNFAGLRSTLATLIPLLWELGLAGVLLVSYPAITGVSWATSFSFVPDLSASVLAVSLLWLLTGVARLGRALLARADPRRRAATDDRGRDAARQVYI